MKSQVLINFRVPSEKKAQYTAASEVIGVSISEICRKALDNAVILSETLKTPKPTVLHPKPVPATSTLAKEEVGSTPTAGINTKGVFVRKGGSWVESPGSSAGSQGGANP
jgi:hypothetical protein